MDSLPRPPLPGGGVGGVNTVAVSPFVGCFLTKVMDMTETYVETLTSGVGVADDENVVDANVTAGRSKNRFIGGGS